MLKIEWLAKTVPKGDAEPATKKWSWMDVEEDRLHLAQGSA